MQTVQPCVTIGSYIWAQDRLPYDEFTLRLDARLGAWPGARHLLVTSDMLGGAQFRLLRLWARWGRLPVAPGQLGG